MIQSEDLEDLDVDLVLKKSCIGVALWLRGQLHNVLCRFLETP